jgi:HSP20 family protein
VAFARWDPIRDLLAIQHRLQRFSPGPDGWVPPVDLSETADHYILTAEVPGLQRSDLQIQMHEENLTVSGVRRDEDSRCEQYHRVERGHGTFSRTFHLPHPVDAAQISADLRDGVLTITCPKSDAGTRRIQVT